jgi:hypothetical protein
MRDRKGDLMFSARIGAGLAGAAILVLAAGPALAASAWTIASAPPTGQDAFLLSVGADSNTDAWAVGSANRAGADQGPLIDHWNGTSWSQSAAPVYPAGETVSLDGVSASGTSDAWAVGFYDVSRYDYYPTTAHWNGSTWTTVAPVQCETGGAAVSSDMLGVADVSPSEAFAVGECVSHASGYIEQWNDSSWAVDTLPDPNPANPGMSQSLSSISADSATDVWAVGSYLIDVNSSTVRYEPYSLHYNGSAWSVVPMPLTPGPDNLLVYDFQAIDAISPTNVWAVGESGDNVGVGGTPTATVVEHYNGTAWSVVPSPTAGTLPYLNGVTATSAGNVWAVGYDTPSGATEPQTFTMQWNGTSWTTVSSPDSGSASRLVGASTTAAAASVWAVGYSGTTGSFNPLVLETAG